LHSAIIHFARWHIYLSYEDRVGCSISSYGVKLPVRLLKSPHISVVSYGCARSIRSSTSYVACYSVILRSFNDDYGGIYIFIMLIRILLGNNNFSNMPY
jgi:hypothetical protein